MEKTGQLSQGVSRCDACGDIATVITGRRAYCRLHAEQEDGEKTAAVTLDSSMHIKSFVDSRVVEP